MNNQMIKQQILEKFSEHPKIDVAKIGVIVENGVVTLTGHVYSMETAALAERLAGDVIGVHAIAQEIKHSMSDMNEHVDEDIAKKLLSEFKRNTMVPEDQIQVHVQDGRVIVKGNVYWLYQKNAVSEVLDSIDAITDKVNQVQVVSPESDQELELHIAEKLAKIDQVNPDGINIKCESGKVVLTGVIEANVERATVLHAVKSIAGVRYVSDKLSNAR